MSLVKYIYLLCFLRLSMCQKRYMFYDVTRVEGFNLRRDVYIRIVNFVRFLNQPNQWSIVLPPWKNIYHWDTRNEKSWSDFFDINSLNIVEEAVEYKHLYKKSNYTFKVDLAIILRNHPAMLSGDFSPRSDIVNCTKNEKKHQIFNLISVKESICINIRMDIFEFANYFKKFLKDNNHLKSFYIHNSEKLIHGQFSEWSEEYWTIRRSMVFAKKLRKKANDFRSNFLNSNDISDKTVMPNDWRHHPWPTSPALGGPYISAHLRRKDFIHGREDSFPSIEEVVSDLIKLSLQYKLNHIFMATDAFETEKSQIKLRCSDFNITVLYYDAVKNTHDGEIAIIDQLIASHGRAFIGTFQSTFTFRIFEERQIMGFPSSTTHIYFCPDRLHVEDENEDSCSRATVWPVKLEAAYTFLPNEIKTEL